MLTDRENRPALAVAFASHALMMGCLALAPADDALGAVSAFAAVIAIFMCITTIIAGIAWVVEAPVIRRLNGSPSQAAQALGGILFMIGLVAVVLAVRTTWTPMPAWAFAGFALLSGSGSVRQFRRSAADDRPEAPALPSARVL